MPTRALAPALAVAVLVTALAASSASAAPWKRVTTPDGATPDQIGLASSDQVALARTADGVLHVVWSHPTSPNTEDLKHTVLTRNGRLGPTNVIESGWTGFSNAALVVEPAGLRAFWGGLRSTDPSDTYREVSTSLSTNGGANWFLQQGGSINPGGMQSYASNISATVRADGSTLQAFAGTLGTWVHAGLTTANSNHDYQAPFGPYGYEPNIATDRRGRTVLAWFSSGAGRSGVLAQFVNVDGSPVTNGDSDPSNDALTMPGTGTMRIGMLGRTPLAALGPSLYTAYPTPNRIRVWRIGTDNAPVVGRIRGSGSPAVTIAPTSDGRLWILWTKGFGDPDVFARRTNVGARKPGAVVNAGHPRDAVQAYKVDASAVGGALDVLGHFNVGTTSTAVTSHRRILPGLTVKARPGAVPSGDPTDVQFTVLDAGDPVQGARVRADGRSARTNSQGRVTLSLSTRSALTARVTHPEYTPASKRIRVRR
ncbi:MAG TPA: hypothetical protein VFM57_06715 [Thermoleophilaceae bacterium]|nr:hypothetical protein [Thermoleophilaceae bacterium]